MMGEMVELTARDGHHLAAYEVDPGGATAAMVIIQEVFGVNDHIRSVVDRYAELGYRSIAPALFDRAERDIEIEYDAEGVTRGRALRSRIEWSWAILDVDAARRHVSGCGPVGVVGYCYGGSVAWLAANELDISASVGYYGGQIRRDHLDREPRCPMLLHFGELDAHIPPEDVSEIGAAHPDVSIHTYPDADHGFNCDARGSFHPASAALALERTTAFLAAHLAADAPST
jgi:carboxymethylenebutenolidase